MSMMIILTMMMVMMVMTFRNITILQKLLGVKQLDSEVD